MRIEVIHLVGALLVPLLVAASNVTFSNGTASASTEGLLSSNAVDLDVWSSAYKQAVALVARMTNEEKIELITGSSVTSVNFTALQFKDGTQGVQGYDYVTGFGETSALVTTWDKTLMWNQFKAVAAEFYGKGFQVTNAPTSQPLGRTPWGGRLVEALGSDPYLNGIAFGLGSKAFSETGVIPGGKHFLLNEQETNRMGMGSSGVAPYSSVADDKTLHETYLWSFYDGVKNGMGAVMCAMTQVNGTLSCENEKLLQQLLKTELGFPGLVYPDVSGQSTAYGSAQAGLDYGSSQFWSNNTVQEGISNGSFSQALLDDKAVRNVIGYFYVNLNNGSQPDYVSSTALVDVRANHSSIVRENGAASLILLKNSNSALPLKKPVSLALFGASAGPVMAGPNYEFSVAGTPDTYQGHLAGGAGSGQTSFPYLITPQQALTAHAAQDGTMIRWIMNDTYTDTISTGLSKRQVDFSGNFTQGDGMPGGNSTGGSDGAGGGFVVPGLSGGTSLSQNYADYASTASACLVFLNAFSGEGGDRSELRNTEQDTLVTTIASNCNNTIVIINSVGPRLVDSWIENENVTAVIYGGLLGQESGNSIADVLYGDVNPSGRLAYTIAKNESDYNVQICTTHVCNFTEGNYIDYKYFDHAGIEPRFAFGFGLSYTSFAYGQASLSVTNQTALSSPYPTGVLSVGGYADLWDEVVSVSIDITNSGTVAGHEVAQLYVSYPEAADQPVRQLRGFERVLLGSGASATVDFSIRRRDLSHWDVVAQQWKLEGGVYTFSVGASSRDLRANVTLTV